MAARAEKPRITDYTLKNLKPDPGGKRKKVWDPELPGFFVRVTAKGRKSFAVVRRQAGTTKQVWTVVGHYPTMSLAEARSAAREALAALSEGKHPNRAKAARLQAEQDEQRRKNASSFGAVAELFIRQHVSRLRSRRGVELLFRRTLIPAFGDKPISEIRRRDIIALVEDIAAKTNRPGRRRNGGEYAARHVLAALRKLFNWALARDIEGVETNPCVRVSDLLGPAKARDRTLTEDELRWVWQAAKSTAYPFGPLIQALMLSGQRLREISNARWPEIDGSSLNIPAERMKGKTAHSVPLTPRMMTLLDDLPRFASGDYLFSMSSGKRPICGYYQRKTRFDRTVAEFASGPVPHWTLHDIRRSVRTGLSITGATPFIAEQIIGHRQSGVHAVYDLHRYDREKLDALLKWEAHLLRIVGETPAPTGNVVPLVAQRG